MLKLSIKTCVSALNGAALSRKAAFQIELAVGLAICALEGDANKAAKQALTETYASAGYQCLLSDDLDYKTVNRRVNVSADLFNTIGLRTITRWVGENKETHMLDAIVEGLRPYELQTVSDVQRFCEPPAVKTSNAAQVAVVPDASILSGPADTGHAKVMQMFRRAADRLPEGSRKVATAHLSITVPPTTNRDELIELASRLLALCEEMREPEKLAA